MVELSTIQEMTSVETLVPSFSNEDVEKLKFYFDLYRNHYKELNAKLIEELRDDPTWGDLIKTTPKNVLEKNNEISWVLQENAIYKNQWLPYIQYQIQQGVMYAQQGYKFSSWYQLVNLVRDHLVPIIAKTYEHDSKLLVKCASGMNLFFDFVMSVIGEAYLHEKRRIIENQMKKQEKLNKELESFAYIISHDLKTPLRGISSLSEWILQDYSDKLDDSGQELLELLKGRVERMEDLINGILVYSRVGRVDVETSKVDLRELVEDCVEVSRNSHDVELIIANELPVLEASKAIMTQIFGNLIDNAIKYNDKDKVVIEVGSSAIGSDYTFYIKDNGPGIPTEFHEKVFKIFQTLDTKDDNKSTGIGLTIVKKAVDLYEGSITIKNPEEGGTMFEFTLKNLKEYGQ